MNQDIKLISSLIFKYINNNINDVELIELEKWRNSSIENESLFKDLINKNTFEKHFTKIVCSNDKVANDWNKLRSKTIGKKPIYISLLKYTAILLPLIIGSILIFYPKDNNIISKKIISPGSYKAVLILANGNKIKLEKTQDIFINSDIKGVKLNNKINTLEYTKELPENSEQTVLKYNKMVVPRGGEYILQLSDGTKVHLNADTELKYPVNFSTTKREVYLKGEAYFEVTKNAKKPFIVHTYGSDVKVLGTSFNLKAYSDESLIKTTLIEGKVEVQGGNNSRILIPGQQSALNKNTNDIIIKKVNTAIYTAWKDGRMIYNETPLSDILNDLSRWYDFELFYMNKSLKDIPFSCNIEKYDNIEQILFLMKNTKKVDFIVKGNIITVKDYKK